MDGIVSTLAGSFVFAQASLGQTSPVGWEDFVAILPALVLLATGASVLVIDLFLRGWNEPATARMPTTPPTGTGAATFITR